MKTEVEKLEDGIVQLTVEVPLGDLEKEISSAYKKVGSQIRIPGFRKGHIPRAIIDQRVGVDTVLNEMASDTIPRLYGEALRESDVEPVGYPDIEIHKLAPGEDLVFKAKVPVKPIPVLGEYKGVKVEIPSREVTEENIDERLGILQERFAELKLKEGDKAAADTGDYLLCDYTVSLGDETIDELAVSDYMLKLGAEDVAAEFSSSAVGAKTGEGRQFTMQMPEDHPNKKIAGKQVQIDLTVKEIKEEIKPPIDDDFAKQVSEFDTLKELREDVKSKLQQKREEYVDTELRRQAVRAAIDNATFVAPEGMIDAEVDSMINRFAAPMTQQGEKLEDYLKATGLSKEMLQNQFFPMAKERVEQEIVLEAIADTEGISVTEDEINEEIRKAAEAEKGDPEQLRKDLERLDRIPDVTRTLLLKKTLEWLAAEAKPAEVSQQEYDELTKGTSTEEEGPSAE